MKLIQGVSVVVFLILNSAPGFAEEMPMAENADRQCPYFRLAPAVSIKGTLRVIREALASNEELSSSLPKIRDSLQGNATSIRNVNYSDSANHAFSKCYLDPVRIEGIAQNLEKAATSLEVPPASAKEKLPALQQELSEIREEVGYGALQAR